MGDRTHFPPYKLVSVADLIPYARNARTHSDAQVTQIAASIAEFGFTNPVLIDGKRGVIAGHGRLLAARKLGLDTVPCIELAHLTAAQKRAYILADNKLALNAGWDTDLLTLELGELQIEGFDLALTGFGENEIAALSAPEVDPEAEWQGMPEFDQPDETAFRTVNVHFKDHAAVQEFARLIGQRIGDKTRFTWFPLVEREVSRDKRYTDEP